MKSVSILTLFGAGLSCCAGSDAHAAPAKPVSVELAGKIPGHTGLVYGDLMKQVLADMVVKDGHATGRLRTTLRHVAGSGYGTELPETVTTSGLQALHFRAGGKQMIALKTSLGNVDEVVEQPELLAVFEDGNQPKLIDTVDVGMDRSTGFARTPRLAIGKGDHALVIYSEHFNAGESYGTTAVTFLRDGKLQLLDTFSTYNMMTCAYQTSQALTFRAKPEKPAGELDAITATVEDKREPTGEICGDDPVPAAFDNKVSTTYRWSAKDAAYKPDGDAIKKLEQDTSDRM